MSIFSRNGSGSYEKGTLASLVTDHKMDLATLQRDYKCVYKPFVEGTGYLVRVYRPADSKTSAVTVTGYSTFDTHPELVVFDGILMGKEPGDISLERRRA